MNDIQLQIKINKMDKDMIELFTEARGRKTLWAVSHSDLMFEDKEAMEALRAGETISMQLVRKGHD